MVEESDDGEALDAVPLIQPGTGIEAGWPVMQHSPLTIEGEIEGFGQFGRGAARTTGWRRGVALLLVASLVGPAAVAVPVAIWRLVDLL